MYGPNSLFRKGCQLFELFQKRHLVIQHRSPEDEEHINFLDKLSSGNPIDLDTMMNYKALSPEDLQLNSNKWQFAPILVAMNRERIDICYRQAIAFATLHNTHVIRWPNRYKNWKNEPSAFENQAAAMEDPAFWQLFVSGAVCFGTANTRPELGLANGTPILALSHCGFDSKN